MIAGSFALDRLTVRYGAVDALTDVTLSVAAGEAVAFVGPSGAGKTTLLRLLNGSVRPTSGTVLVNGRPVTSLAPGELRRLRSSIGFVHQDLRLVSNVRVLPNVLAGRLGRFGFLASIRTMFRPGRTLLREVHAILDRVGIADKMYFRVDRLSGGQRQRVAIARALFQDPMAIVADEPVSSVDPARARDAVSLLVDLCRERGLTLCVSLHNLELAREFFPRLVGLRRGRILFDAPATEVEPERFDALYRLDPVEMLDAAS